MSSAAHAASGHTTPPPELGDDALVDGFETATLPPEAFRHREHVRAAWIYGTRWPPEEALARFCSALRRFAAAHGAAHRYHATLSWAFVAIVLERIARGRPDRTFAEFAADNPDLLTWDRGQSVVDHYYPREVLESPLARSVFVMPPPTRSGRRRTGGPAG